jgi:predicted transcriptional regulator
MKNEMKKELILKSVAKMLADKDAVRSYIKGKTSIQSLTSKGIKLAKPL